MIQFEEAHLSFIQHHLGTRTGERRGRLERGHKHAESLFMRQIWWPLKGNFDHLHPEFEVLDWRGRPYFADFVYSPERWKILIEIKGFGEHITNMDRQKYCNELNRETFLQAMGYHVISFSYDDVAHKPEVCIFLLRAVLSRFEAATPSEESNHPANYGLMRYAISLARPVRPIDFSEKFMIDHRTAISHLHRLVQLGWLRTLSSGAGKRIRYYEVTQLG